MVSVPLVEMVVDHLRHLRADAADRGEIGDAGAAHRLGRAEMLEQRALARRSNTLNLVERRGLHLLLAPGAMGADGEAMGLVAELLDTIKHGVARLEQQRLATLHVDALAAGIAVRSLGNSGELDLAKPELVEHGHGRRQLPGPPSISTRSGAAQPSASPCPAQAC